MFDFVESESKSLRVGSQTKIKKTLKVGFEMVSIFL